MTPTGTIKTPGIDGVWDNITRYDQHIHAAADPVGWPITRVRGTIAIESAGLPTAHQPNSQGDSYGLMQVVPYTADPARQGWEGWHELVKQKAGLPKNASRQKVINALYDPAVNIAVGVAILEGFYQQHGTLDAASSAFFTGKPDWSGPGDSTNKNTPAWYRKTLNALISEQRAFEPADPIAVIMGVDAYNNFFGFDQPGGNPTYYDYGLGHGLDGDNHTGYDIETRIGQTLYSPGPGMVTCSGTGRGAGSWQTGCAAFPDYLGKGAGRVEVMLDAGVSVVLGHCSEALVPAGTRVAAGQAVAKAGGMNSPHVHLETRIWRNGDYVITDPYQTLVQALGAVPVIPKVERLPIPQPAEFDVSVEVTVTADELPVLQRADLNAAPVGDALKKGETFRAVYQVVGNDGRIYWISTLGGRVPAEGTTAPGWKAGGTNGPGVDPGTVADLVEGARAEIDTRLREVIASLSAA